MSTYPAFFISGTPKPKGSWTPLRTKDGKIKFRHASNATARWCIDAKRQIMILWHGRPVLEGPIFVECLFLLPRPKTVVRTHPVGKFEGDVDKQARAILDALTDIAYKDDSQVVDLVCKKRYTDEMPGVWITISTDNL